MAELVIVSRGSLLARTQSEHVAAALRAAHPGLAVRIDLLTTRGDRDATTPLPAIGGKGLFTHELEEALRRGEADLAVHSLKDLPTELADDLALACVPPREDPRDALILPEHAPAPDADAPLAALAPGALIGTSSLRRVAMLRHQRPDLLCEPVRGNLDTRFRKLDEGPYQALILAAAGIRRLGWQARLSAVLPVEWMVPAPGQGALGLEGRADDARLAELLAPLECPVTRAAVTAERAFLAGLGGGCQTPIAAHAEPTGPGLRLRVAVLSGDAGERVDREAVGPLEAAEALGRGLAAALLGEGYGRLLEPAGQESERAAE